MCRARSCGVAKLVVGLGLAFLELGGGVLHRLGGTVVNEVGRIARSIDSFLSIGLASGLFFLIGMGAMNLERLAFFIQSST